MIEFKDVCKEYKDKKILENINFRINDGEFIVLIGESGCGETTTLKMINKLILPSSGSIEIDGKNIADMDSVELRRNIGYVIQHIGLFPHLTIGDNIKIIAKLRSKDKEAIDKKARSLLEMVHLDPNTYMDKYPSEMSGGQQQRAGVARAFMTDANIILMDEPFSALDPITRTQIQDALLEIQSTIHKTIVFVTHDMDEAIKLADRICIMENGRIVQFDTPENILRFPADDFVRKFVGSNRIWSSPEFIKTKDIMITSPVCCRPETTIFKCIEMMSRRKVDTLMVTDRDKKLKGILFAESLIGTQNLEKKAEAVMRTDYTSALPESSIVDLLAIFDSKRLSTLPVVAEDGHLEGLITRSTLVNTLSRQFLQEEEKDVE